MKMRMALAAFAVAAGLAGAQAAFGQSVTFDYQDSTDQGWGTAFGNDASASWPIDNVAGSLRMRITNTTGFQEAGRQAGNDGSNFYLAMQAAAANEPGYEISYDWYVDTSLTPGANGNFLQIGTFV